MEVSRWIHLNLKAFLFLPSWGSVLCFLYSTTVEGFCGAESRGWKFLYKSPKVLAWHQKSGIILVLIKCFFFKLKLPKNMLLYSFYRNYLWKSNTLDLISNWIDEKIVIILWGTKVASKTTVGANRGLIRGSLYLHWNF